MDCGVGNFGGSGGLDVSGGSGCLGLVSGEWKREEGEGGARCMCAGLGNGFQEIGGLEVLVAGREGVGNLQKKEKGILALSHALSISEKVEKENERELVLTRANTRVEV